MRTFFSNGQTEDPTRVGAGALAANQDHGQGDGRNIDLTLAGLMGEAAQQRHVTARAHPNQTQQPVWEETPTADQRRTPGPTYYDRPVVKEPVWIWTVPLYFFVGGAAGAAAVLGAAAQWFGGAQLRGLVTRCRWLAAIGANLGAVLLIADLGRPGRFLHMLRVFRPTSPMSMGSWLLASSGGAMTLSALLDRRRGWLRWVGDGVGAVNSLLGIGLAGYTGVLLANSVVPLWVAARRSLPVLFVTSGIASAAALLDFTRLNPREANVVRAFGLVGRVAELLAATAVEREAKGIERVGRPLQEGRSGAMWKMSKYLGILGLLVALLPGNSRSKRSVAALATAVSSLLLRYGLMAAGKASARDPQATFQQQRSATQ
ncbi:MAG: NrfD/PsrC family molybdoenzyme membrane anchor subunit [Caldilineaceae bacterium]